MPGYSKQLAREYTKYRDQFTATDECLFRELKLIGVVDKDVLDFGCGDGKYAVAISKLGSKSITGIDVSSEMIALAEIRQRDQNLSIDFQIADGTRLPFPDETFDVVFSNFVLQHFRDIRLALHEIHRVLRKNGTLVATLGTMRVRNGFESFYNSSTPVLLGDTHAVLVHDFLDSEDHVCRAFISSHYKMIHSQILPNAFVRVDPDFNPQVVEELHSFLIRAEKN